MKILHLATDEKFIDAANVVFEHAFPEQNTFVIVKAPANPPLRYVTKQTNVMCLIQSADTHEQIMTYADTSDVIILHGLDHIKVQVFNSLKVVKKFVWMVWGAEVYNPELFDDDFLQEETRKLGVERNQGNLFEFLKKIYRQLKYGRLGSVLSGEIKKAIFEMPAIGILHKEEFDYFKDKALLSASARFIPFTYYPWEFLFKKEVLNIGGRNILLGNSASPTNNHIEAIDMIAAYDLGERKVITPLSYGDVDYAKKVIAHGERKLGASFYPLLDFLPLMKYNELMASCGIVIMNMTRQQAVGNIVSAVFSGAKVFLNDTTVYQYLKNLKYHVFLINKDLKPAPDSLNPLDPAEATQNRTFIKRDFSLTIVSEKLRLSILDYVGGANA